MRVYLFLIAYFRSKTDTPPAKKRAGGDLASPCIDTSTGYDPVKVRHMRKHIQLPVTEENNVHCF